MTITVGSLFSGYGGLDLGLHMVLGNTVTSWVSDIEPGPEEILRQRFPYSPNLGDITAINWDEVEPVDIICGGSPCQDLSIAGTRDGMFSSTRSGLWMSMLQGIDVLRPKLVIWENVRGALSAKAYSRLGSDAGRLDGRPVLRALGRVLGDLANIGYDARWTTVRASSVGAPHRRDRVFVAAYPQGLDFGWGVQEHQVQYGNDVKLFPSPRANDANNSSTAPSAMRHVEVGFGSLAEVVGYNFTLLPTSLSNDGEGVNRYRDNLPGAAYASEMGFGKYTGAVSRWTDILGRTPPSPLELGRRGGKVLSPRFVEWMMGLPAGWVTDTGLSRKRQIRALGNGVVPQQAARAISDLMCYA